MNFIIFFTLFFSSFFAYSQQVEIDLEKGTIGKIELEFDTYLDLEKFYGKGQDSVLTSGNIISSGCFYPEMKMLAVRGDKTENMGEENVYYDSYSDPDGAYLQRFIFEKNAELLINSKGFVLGKSLVKEFVPVLPKLKLEYQSSQEAYLQSFDGYFTVNLFTEIKGNHFSRDLNNYLNQPVCKIEIFYTRNKTNKSLCVSPVYAPKDEKHQNCYKRSVRNIFKYGSSNVKQGLWKEFYPNHKLKFEGKFELGKPIGHHKWYKLDGSLEKEEDFGWGLKSSQIIVIGLLLFFVILLLYYIFLRRKK